MARRSAAAKAETHEQIVQHAAGVFRARGSSVGIGDVMQDLGLTHGGFYRHFATKDDLFVEAMTASLAEVAARLERAAQKSPGRELAAVITTYLSLEHLRHPESWCVVATLAPEIARQPPGIRKRINVAMRAHMQRLARFVPGAEAERVKKFVVLYSGMAGAMAMARAMGDRTTREFILTSARDYYLSAFAGSN